MFAIPIFANLVTFDEVFKFLVKFFGGSLGTKFQVYFLGDVIPSLAGLTAVVAIEIFGSQVD